MTIFTPIATYLLYFYLSLPDSHICPQNKDSLPSNSPVCALYSGDCPSSPSKFCQVSFSSAQEACQDANVIAYIEGQCAELTLQTCQPGMPEASSLGDKACSFSALRRLGGFSQDVAMNDVAIAEVCKSELAGFFMQGDCSDLEGATKHICTNSKANKINGADSDICVYYTGDDCEGKVCRRTENAEGLICKDDSVLFYTEGACKESVKQDEMLLLDQDEAINVVEPEKPKEDEEWDLSNDVPEVREEVQPDGTILLVPLAPRHSKPDEVLDLGNDVPEVEAEELSDGTIKFNPKSSVYEPEEPELHDEVDNTEPILMDVKEEGFPPQEPELHDEVDNTEPVLMDVKEKGFPPKEPELHDEVDNTEPVLQDVQEKGFEPEVLPTQEKEIICKVVQVKAEVQPNGDILLTPIESEKPEELKAPEEPELHDEVDNTEPILMDVKEEGFPPQEPELHDEVDNTKPVLMDVKEEGFPPQEPEPELYDEVDNTEPVLMDVKEEGFPPQEPELKDKLDVTEPALVDVQEKGFEPEKLPPQEKEVHDKVVETQAEVQPNGDILLTPVDAEKPEILDFKAEEPKPVVKLENPLDIMGIEPKEADATISNGKVIYSMDSAIEPEEKR